MERNGFPEETYYTFSYSPIPDDDGSPAASSAPIATTRRASSANGNWRYCANWPPSTPDGATWREACRTQRTRACEQSARYPVRAALCGEPGGTQSFTLVATSGIERGHPAAPESMTGERRHAAVAYRRSAAHSNRASTSKVYPTRFGAACRAAPGILRREQAVILPVAPGSETAPAVL